ARFLNGWAGVDGRGVRHARLQLIEMARQLWLLFHEDVEPDGGREGTGRGAGEALAGLGADGRLLLVGHEPDLSNVIAALTGARADLKKGGLAIVRLEGARGELTVLMRPRELGLIAGVPVGGE